jgi:hypothetical protein
MERMIAIISYLEEGNKTEGNKSEGNKTEGNKSEGNKTHSLFGNILTDYPNSFGYNWDMYQTDKKNGKNMGVKVIKLWSGR